MGWGEFTHLVRNDTCFYLMKLLRHVIAIETSLVGIGKGAVRPYNKTPIALNYWRYIGTSTINQSKSAAIFYSESSPGSGNHDASERVRTCGLEQEARGTQQRGSAPRWPRSFKTDGLDFPLMW